MLFPYSENTDPKLNDYSARLIDVLLPHAIVKRYPPGSKKLFTVNGECYCYILLEGHLAMHRATDHRLVSNISPPALIGLHNMPEKPLNDYIKTLESSLLALISVKNIFPLIAENNLWETLARYLVFVVNQYYAISMDTSSSSAYNLIKTQLIQLINEDEYVRLNTTAEKYIREKTGLSRSGIMRVLAELKFGGNIKIERGVLMEIKRLPLKY